jgi:hypothetical protein
MARRKRKKLHPLLREIARRQREIATLLRSARMLGLDCSPVLPAPKPGISPRRAAAYYREMAASMYAPDENSGSPIDHPEEC